MNFWHKARLNWWLWRHQLPGRMKQLVYAQILLALSR